MCVDLQLALDVAVVIAALTAVAMAGPAILRLKVSLSHVVFLLWAGGGLFASVIVRTWDPHWQHSMSSRMKLGILFGLPASVASLLLIAMLLELCDQVVGLGARLRLTLEALTVASGIYVPLWVFA